MKSNSKTKRFFVPIVGSGQDKESQHADTRNVSAPMLSHKLIKIKIKAGVGQC